MEMAKSPVPSSMEAPNNKGAKSMLMNHRVMALGRLRA